MELALCCLFVEARRLNLKDYLSISMVLQEGRWLKISSSESKYWLVNKHKIYT